MDPSRRAETTGLTTSTGLPVKARLARFALGLAVMAAFALPQPLLGDRPPDPYQGLYTSATIKEAQAAASSSHLPLAWVASSPGSLYVQKPDPGTYGDLCQMAFSYLRQRAIVISLDNPVDIQTTYSKVYNYFGGGITDPTVVISNADATTFYGRVPAEQLQKDREKPLAAMLASFPMDATGAQSLRQLLAPPSPAQPVQSPAQSPRANPVAATPPPPPPWTAPEVMPAQPNWTWTTSDGKTYQNVVVTQMDAKSVTISHSLGFAHIPVYLLSPDLKKRLGYP